MELEYRVIALKKIDTELFSDVVTEVLWSVRGKASDGLFVAHSAKTTLSIDELDNDTQDFISYPDLRESIVAVWIEELIESDIDFKNEILEILNDKLQLKYNFSATESNKVPWEYAKERFSELFNHRYDEPPTEVEEVDVPEQTPPDLSLGPDDEKPNN